MESKRAPKPEKSSSLCYARVRLKRESEREPTREGHAQLPSLIDPLSAVRSLTWNSGFPAVEAFGAFTVAADLAQATLITCRTGGVTVRLGTLRVGTH